MTKSKIVYENNEYKYWDKNGNRLHEGDHVILDGKERELYLTADGQLGTDATNPKWIESGRAVECEYGIYPLTPSDIEVLEKVN